MPQIQHRKCEKNLSLSLITPLLSMSSVDYLMWISVTMSWSVSLSACFISASWNGFLQPRINSPASSTSLMVHTQRHSLSASATCTDLCFSSIDNIFFRMALTTQSHTLCLFYRSPTAVSGVRFRITLLHWDFTWN